MDLPPELRQQIWQYVVISDQPITIKFHNRKRSFKSAPSYLRSGKRVKTKVLEDENRKMVGKAFNLMWTSNQIYQEASPTYYAMNTFSYSFSDDLSAFGHGIGNANASLVSQLAFNNLECMYPFFLDVDKKGPLLDWLEGSAEVVALQFRNLKVLDLVSETCQRLAVEDGEGLQAFSPSVEVRFRDEPYKYCHACRLLMRRREMGLNKT